MTAKTISTLGIVLFVCSLLSMVLIYAGGGKIFDVGEEATINRQKLTILDNITRVNKIKIEENKNLIEKALRMSEENNKLLRRIELFEIEQSTNQTESIKRLKALEEAFKDEP